MFEVVENNKFYYDFVKDVVNGYETILEDSNTVFTNNRYTAWPEYNLHNGKWNVFGIVWKHQVLDGSKITSSTFNILKPHLSIIQNCGFSIMMPGCEIKPHTGYTNKVLRCHLGLSIPENCAIKVGNTTSSWKEKEVLIFDDTQIHSAWNRSDKPRIILLTDLVKPV